jgi:glycosyltransferase involved in cell wall biosynthesis
MELTRDLLRSAGHEAIVLSPEVQEFGDIVHFFGSNDAYWGLAQLCLERRIPYVVSAIWYVGGSRLGLALDRSRRMVGGNYPRKARKLLTYAQRVLVPSPELIWRLETYFGVEPDRCDVVPSGAISPEYLMGSASADGGKLPDDFVVCVGNWLERKNQLGLIMAMKGSGKSVLFAGGFSDQPYLDRCRAEIGGDQEFIILGPVSHRELGRLVGLSRVFAVPSRLEDFMIAGVEAGALGKPLVLSSSWNAGEVYGSWAALPDPRSSAEIRAAVDTAWSLGGRVEGQAEWFLERYSEDAFLSRTLDSYRLAQQ